MASNRIYGSGTPSQISQAGVEYIDLQNGTRYIQTLAPNGNQWESFSSTSSSPFTTTEGVLYHENFVLSQAQITGATTNFYTLKNLSPSSDYYYVYTDIDFYMSGTAFNAAAGVVYISMGESLQNSLTNRTKTSLESNPSNLILSQTTSASFLAMDATTGNTLSFKSSVAFEGGDSTSQITVFTTYTLIQK